MIISLIVAISNNGVIGNKKGGIPWHLPRDTAHFRAYTAGKWLLLGRKTFREMDGWFTDQVPLVLTNTPELEVPRGHTCSSGEEAISLARGQKAGELVVCGGAMVYELMIRHVEKMIITKVDTRIADGIPFPTINLDNWELNSQERFPKDSQNEFQTTFQVLSRKQSLE